MTGSLETIFFVFLAGILGSVLVGLRNRNFPAVVNGLVSIVAALSPRFLEYWLSGESASTVAFGPELPTWIAIAGFFHMLGMLGWYDSVPWWDHLTHTVSATFIAAFVYAAIRTYGRYALDSPLPSVYIITFTVLFTLAVGVFWEFIELAAREVGEYIGKPPVLEYYGLRDTIFDMLFNGAGSLVVVTFDVRVFAPVTDLMPGIVAGIIVEGTILLFVGTLALGVVLDRFTPVDRGTDRG